MTDGSPRGLAEPKDPKKLVKPDEKVKYYRPIVI
jgi:hypothetical protein